MASPSLSKPVRQLLADGGDLPEKYIHKRENRAAVDATTLPVIEVPVIDVSLLTSPSPAGEEELAKLRSALGSCGCFQAINHGMTASFVDQVLEISKQFFALPMEEKQIYSREILHEYTAKLTLMNELLLKAMAKSLNIEENCFLNQYGERATMTARFNSYPACPRPDLTLGIKQHADASTITFLLQDKEVEGLQILNDGQWFRVPIVPHAILINVGDQAEIMSNGMFKSPVHRVVTNSERERITLAVFCLPDPEQEIGPVEELVEEKRPKLYKKMKDYVAIYFHNYQLGKRPIDAVKI